MFENQIEKWKEYLKKEKVMYPNKERNAEFMTAYEILKHTLLLPEKDTEVELKASPLQTGCAYIRIRATDIEAHEMHAVARAMQLADNIQIYPTSDERVVWDLTFEDVFYVEEL